MWNKSSLEGELLDSLHLLTAVHLLEPAPLWSFEVFSTLPLKLDHVEQVKLGRAASWSHHQTLAAPSELAISMECLWNLQLPLQTAHTGSRLDRVAPSSSHSRECSEHSLVLPTAGWLLFHQLLAMVFLLCSLNSPPQAWIEWGSKLGSEQPWVFTNQWHITTSVTALHCSWQWAMPSSFSWIGEELRTLLVHLKHHSTSRED